MEVCPYSYFWWCGYFRGPWVSFVTTDDFPVRDTKNTARIGATWTHWLHFCFWPMLAKNYYHISKGCKPDNFESLHSLKLDFTNVWGLCSNFFDYDSFLESKSPEILALCETNLSGSIDSGNFSGRGYLSLIQKDSTTHMHGLTVYVK